MLQIRGYINPNYVYGSRGQFIPDPAGSISYLAILVVTEKICCLIRYRYVPVPYRCKDLWFKVTDLDPARNTARKYAGVPARPDLFFRKSNFLRSAVWVFSPQVSGSALWRWYSPTRGQTGYQDSPGSTSPHPTRSNRLLTQSINHFS